MKIIDLKFILGTVILLFNNALASEVSLPMSGDLTTLPPTSETKRSGQLRQTVTPDAQLVPTSSTGKQQLQEEEEWEEEIEEVEEEASEPEQLTKKELLEKLEAKWPELLRSKNINEDAINRNFLRHFHGFPYYFPEGIIEFVHKDVLTRAQIRLLRTKKSFDELCLHINMDIRKYNSI